LLGFEISPVKSSRRDQFNIVTFRGENGTMNAGIWCKEHAPVKPVIHQMHDEADEAGLNALQFYVQKFKQADLTLTGTVRKANLMSTAAKTSGTTPATARRLSTTTMTTPTSGNQTNARNGASTEAAFDAYQPGDKVCISCGIDVSPKWWAIDNSQERELTNGHYGTIGSEAQKFVEQRKFQCHKCRKSHRTPKAHSPRPALRAPEEPHPILPDTNVPPPPSSAQSRRSPPPTAQVGDTRDGGRAVSGSWAQHQPLLPLAPPMHASIHPQAHLPGGPRAPVLPHGSPPVTSSSMAPSGGPQAPPLQAPHRSPYADWHPRPGSQHSPPPRHMNGGQPLGNLSSLRPPPAMTGPPPTPSMLHGHPQPYINGMPQSPRRGPGPGPVLSPPFPQTYQPPPPPPPPQSHQSPGHSLNNGIPPTRSEAYAPGLSSHRPYPVPHDGPYHARHSLGANLEQSPPQPPMAPRNGPERSASTASKSPSLRNLLS
jgi:hypothetical protein